ncbi:MAG TPA: diacylglycerol kinase family protein, partial [Thermoleophilaceae bacterium]|nr:diacylglycerol kinase family protein [Thermoleophilaceae bacterium]
MIHERWRPVLAALSLLCLVVALGVALALAIDGFPRGLTVLACLVGAAALFWMALPRSGTLRVGAAIAGACLLIAAIVLVVVEGRLLADLVVLAASAAAFTFARLAFATRAALPPAAAPKRPVLFYNPKSGGGKAERFHVADEARKRGIEPRELRPGDDLVALVETAIREGADGLAMAGGDGSQAIVAAAAAEHGLPYACIPSGTRNHFALDLGVDRNDVVGALDAFVDGRERVVDLAEVNGRVFVNNVSLGIYADAVQQEGYRDAKIRTMLATAPRTARGGDGSSAVRWRGADGAEATAAAMLLVSNDPYRLGRAVAAGTRPRLDAGTLGIASVRAGSRRVDQWSAPTFEVRADEPVALGVDGEAIRLEPPLEFRSRPRALRVRIAPRHPGASP